MVKTLKEFIDYRIKKLLRKRFHKIVEINRKYAKPRLKITPVVRLALILLRFYLLFLIGILVYKFITLVK